MVKTKRDKFLSVCLFLLGIAGSMCVISCSDDGDDGPAAEAKKYPYFLFDVKLSDDLFEISSPVRVTYFDTEGKEVQETLTGKEWKKTLTGENFPYAAGYTMTFTCDETKWTKDIYTISYSQSVTSALKDTNEKFYNLRHTSNSSSYQVRRENIRRYIDSLNATMYAHYTLDADGQAEKVTEK